MGIKFFIYMYILWISESSAFLRLPKNVEKLENVDVRIKTGSRVRRSVDALDYPLTYDLSLRVDGNDVNIHLTRNDILVADVPTISLQNGLLPKLYLQDQEETAFYQDTTHGAAFIVQQNADQVESMYGTFHSHGNEYTVQNSMDRSNLLNETSRFDIVKEEKIEVEYRDTMSGSFKRLKRSLGHRHKRAAGAYQIELLIVCDYAVYKYWYDQSDKATDTEKSKDADTSVRQFYAFVINGMDAMFKNIQTSAYTVSVVYAGIVIAKTPNDATWTESIKVMSDNTVDAGSGLQNFRSWVQNNINSLPGNDHSMLFTRYDLTYQSSKSVAGLAYTGAICGSWSQSIVEDGFSFLMITTAAHELGHSLGAYHDGTSNNCLATDAYVMSPSNSPQTNANTATNPWRFSTCSTDYFTTTLNNLESSNQNCLKVLSSTFDPTAQSPLDQNLAGQVYDADAQCKQLYGTASYMCRSQYNNDYSTLCNVLWCYNPGTGLCSSSIAGEGTLCGNNKWCISGTCTSDNKAPSGNDACLYGDDKGVVFLNGWTCADMVANAPNNCAIVPERCCDSCNPQSSTSSTTASTTTTSPTSTTTTTPPTFSTTIPTTTTSMSPTSSTTTPTTTTTTPPTSSTTTPTTTTTPPTSSTTTPTTTKTTTSTSSTTSSTTTTTTLPTSSTTTPTTTTTTPRTSSTTTTPSASFTTTPTTDTTSTYATSSTTNTTSSDIDFKKLIIIGGGAAAGALVVIVTLIIIVVMCMKRTTTQKKQTRRTRQRNLGYPYTNGGYDNPAMIPDYNYTKSRY